MLAALCKHKAIDGGDGPCGVCEIRIVKGRFGEIRCKLDALHGE